MMTSLLVLARTLHIGSALLLTSFLLFQSLIVGAGNQSSRPVRWRTAQARQTQRALIVLFLLHLISGAMWLWFVTASMSDCSLTGALHWTLLRIALSQTQFGQLWVWRSGFAFLLGLLLFAKFPSIKITPGSTGPALAASLLLLFSLTWAGHAAASAHHRSLHLAVDLTHLAAAAVWPLGLVPLAFFLRFISRAYAMDSGVLLVLQRFSHLSLPCVIFLLSSGIANSLFFIPAWSSLVTTPYGQLLLAKVALFLIMVALGAVNRLVFLPALKNNPGPPALFQLRRSVILESILALVIVLIVGAMGAISPPPPSS